MLPPARIDRHQNLLFLTCVNGGDDCPISIQSKERAGIKTE
jgi:hypothetical protein